MAKVKNGADALITREQYKAIKRMDRPDMEAFMQSVFKKGYADGRQITKVELADNLAENALKKARAELFAMLEGASGIGPATMRKISEAVEKWNSLAYREAASGQEEGLDE